MRTIVRASNTPSCLSQQPSSLNWAQFMRIGCHKDVDLSLRCEQLGLCCYCELEVESANSHIEHMEPRAVNSARCYDYTNLAISCNGGSIEHCGHFKDNRDKNPGVPWNSILFVTPHDPDTQRLLQYLPNGVVVAVQGPRKAVAEYLIAYLNLNCPRLQDRRRAHAREILNIISSESPDELRSWANEYYLEVGSRGLLRQFQSLSRLVLSR
jgi:uncharacterized protein (TIGR02646 family)